MGDFKVLRELNAIRVVVFYRDAVMMANIT